MALFKQVILNSDKELVIEPFDTFPQKVVLVSLIVHVLSLFLLFFYPIAIELSLQFML